MVRVFLSNKTSSLSFAAFKLKNIESNEKWKLDTCFDVLSFIKSRQPKIKLLQAKKTFWNGTACKWSPPDFYGKGEQRCYFWGTKGERYANIYQNANTENTSIQKIFWRTGNLWHLFSARASRTYSVCRVVFMNLLSEYPESTVVDGIVASETTRDKLEISKWKKYCKTENSVTLDHKTVLC